VVKFELWSFWAVEWFGRLAGEPFSSYHPQRFLCVWPVKKPDLRSTLPSPLLVSQPGQSVTRFAHDTPLAASELHRAEKLPVADNTAACRATEHVSQNSPIDEYRLAPD
jgi:hypothetical protein